MLFILQALSYTQLMINTPIFYFIQLSRVICNPNLLYLVLIVTLITSCTKDDPKSGENKINTFQLNIDNTLHDGQINQETGKISFAFENDIPSAIVPSITYDTSAAISPSEQSAQNFNNIIRYTVTAANGSEKAYTIVVNTPSASTSNVAPGPMELVDTTFDGREVSIDWTDALDTDEVVYKVFKNSIEVGEYLISEVKIPFTYNKTEKIEIYAIDKMGANSKLEINLETPTSELLYIRNSAGVLFCIDTKVQDIMWVKGTRDRFPSPAVVNNQIVYGNNDNLVGINLLNGSEQPAIYEKQSTYFPTDFLHDENTFYIKDYGKVYAYDINTKEVKWESYRSQTTVPTTLTSNLIITPSYRDYDIEGLDKNTGEIVWTFGLNYGKIVGRPMRVGDALILVHSRGVIYSLDSQTGEINWEVSGASGPSSLIEYNNTIIAVGDRKIYALDGATGTELWSEPYPDYMAGSPFIHNGKLFIGRTGNGEGSLYAINPDTGTIIWERQVSGSVSSSPVAFENKVYFADQDGFLYCFSADTGAQLWRITVGAYVTTSPTFVKGNSEVIVYPTLLGFN